MTPTQPAARPVSARLENVESPPHSQQVNEQVLLHRHFLQPLDYPLEIRE